MLLGRGGNRRKGNQQNGGENSLHTSYYAAFCSGLTGGPALARLCERFYRVRRKTVDGSHLDTLTTDLYRRALERRRDTLRRTWLWSVAYLAPMYVLTVLPRSLGSHRALSTIFEAAVVLAAVVILRTLASRLSDMLQQEIDSIG